MARYMQNMSEEQQAAADLVLAPLKLPEKGSPCDKATSANKSQEWMLPCHSLVLSIHSKVFAASDRHASSTATEQTEEGRRIIRLPVSQDVAHWLLLYCYGNLHNLRALDNHHLCGLAFISNMQAVSGKVLNLLRCYKIHNVNTTLMPPALSSNNGAACLPCFFPVEMPFQGCPCRAGHKWWAYKVATAYSCGLASKNASHSAVAGLAARCDSELTSRAKQLSMLKKPAFDAKIGNAAGVELQDRRADLIGDKVDVVDWFLFAVSNNMNEIRKICEQKLFSLSVAVSFPGQNDCKCTKTQCNFAPH